MFYMYQYLIAGAYNISEDYMLLLIVNLCFPTWIFKVEFVLILISSVPLIITYIYRFYIQAEVCLYKQKAIPYIIMDNKVCVISISEKSTIMLSDSCIPD